MALLHWVSICMYVCVSVCLSVCVCACVHLCGCAYICVYVCGQSSKYWSITGHFQPSLVYGQTKSSCCTYSIGESLSIYNPVTIFSNQLELSMCVCVHVCLCGLHVCLCMGCNYVCMHVCRMLYI